MADESKNPVVTEVMEAFGQIWDELYAYNGSPERQNRTPVQLPADHALTLAVWCVGARHQRGTAFQNLPVFGRRPAQVPVPVATPRSH